MVDSGVQRNLFGSVAIKNSKHQDDCASHPNTQNTNSVAPDATTSVFDSHIAFMEKKKLVEQGRKKKVRVL